MGCPGSWVFRQKRRDDRKLKDVERSKASSSAISLSHIEGHFQVSNELVLLSLESWLRSPVRPPVVLLQILSLLEQICFLLSNVVISFDQFYYLAFRFQRSLLPHDQLCPDVNCLNILCS